MKEQTKVLIAVSILGGLSLLIVLWSILKPYDFVVKNYFQLVEDTQEVQRLGHGNLMNQDDLLDRLGNFYEELQEDSTIYFMSLDFGTMGVLGHWDKPAELVSQFGEVDLRNRPLEVDGKSFLQTPIDSVRVDSQAFTQFNLHLIEGEEFSTDDYLLMDKKIPLILGSDFRAHYSIGEEIPLYYLGEIWSGTIQGFLEEDSTINMDQIEYNLNRSLLFPAFRWGNKEEALQKHIAYDLLEGYLILPDKSAYKKAAKRVEKLAKKYELPFLLLRGY